MTQPWQTRAAEFHPYLVDTLDALPGSLRQAAMAALQPGASVVRALVVPPEYRSDGTSDSHTVPEQALIFTDSGALHVQARSSDNLVTPTYVQSDMLLYLRSSHLLLYGGLELACAAQGEPTKLTMEFNAVGWRLMDTEWRTLVGKAIGMAPLALDAERSESENEQAQLALLPAKFAEGLRKYGLYTGEALLGFVFQPATWTQTLVVFDQQVMPNTLVALTNASVLILMEEPALVRKSEQFGLIITRIPLRAIVDVQPAPRDQLQEIKFRLARAGTTDEISVLLDSETAQLWLDLWPEHAV